MTLRAPHLSPKRPILVTVFLAVAGFQSGSPPVLTDGTGAKPFAQTDWPNPQVLGVQQPAQTGVPLALLEAKKPFFQSDWPNPQIPGTQEPVQTRRDPDFLETGDKPFLQTEWPNPTVAVKIQTPFQVGISTSILDIAGAKPFFQSEWPNPLPVFIQEPVQFGKPIVLEAPAVITGTVVTTLGVFMFSKTTGIFGIAETLGRFKDSDTTGIIKP